MKGVQCYEHFGGIALKIHTFFHFSYQPYRKPNDEPLCINRNSNHPPTILFNTIVILTSTYFYSGLNASGFNFVLEPTGSCHGKGKRADGVIISTYAQAGVLYEI